MQERKNLLALKIADVIKLAQANNRDAAVKLLTEIEKQIFNNKATDANYKLIEAVKARFRLIEGEEEVEQRFRVAEKIGAGSDKPKPGVSVVNCCRNRTENLLKALPTWLAHKKIREVIIIDWTSDIPVSDSLQQAGIKDSRIKVVRVENEPRWILSYAFNLGFRLAQYDHILKIDADITLKEDFFDKNPLLPGTFIAGDWTKAEKGQEHINGFFYVKNKDLLRVKGFNEYITTYGWDDDDIYARLASSGLQRVCVDTKSIYHIPHDDASRLDGMGNGDANAWTELNRNPLYKIRTNRYIANVMPYWNGDRSFAPFKILSWQARVLTVERLMIDMPHYVSASMRKVAEVYAATEILSWQVGPSIFHLEADDFETLLTTKKLSEISQFDVDMLIRGLSKKYKITKHSLYLEFDLKSNDYDFSLLSLFVKRARKIEDLAIYVSSYGNGADQFASAMVDEVIKLKSWVRVGGLKSINQEDLRDIDSILSRDSGFHIKVTDEFLNFLKGQEPRIYIQRQKDRLYIDMQHGLGNRLRAYGSAAAIAKATDRELVVVWVPDFHCDCRFTDLFDYDGPIIESYQDLPLNLRRFNYMEIEADGNKGEEIIMENGVDVLVRSAFILRHADSNWESECAEIRSLRPAREVLSLVNSVNLPDNSIGVHVRMEAGKGLDNNDWDSEKNWSRESHGQIHYWREKSHYSAFIKRIDAILREEPNRNIFLATDLPDNYDVFVRTYKERLLYLPRKAYDRSREQIVYGLADAILLSKTKFMLGSTWSSFSELAMRLSTCISKVEMSGSDF